MPDPTDLPKGCPFNPRCDNATPQCSERVPENIEISPGHFVKCLNLSRGD